MISEVLKTNQGIRNQLVAIALEWERRFGTAPSITSAISEYDAAQLVGHTDTSYGTACFGRTAVSKGHDFIFDGIRYQIKASRPSGKRGSPVTLVARANNYDWDRLIWILYNNLYEIQEAWEWEVTRYRVESVTVKYVRPEFMRKGNRLK